MAEKNSKSKNAEKETLETTSKKTTTKTTDNNAAAKPKTTATKTSAPKAESKPASKAKTDAASSAKTAKVTPNKTEKTSTKAAPAKTATKATTASQAEKENVKATVPKENNKAVASKAKVASSVDKTAPTKTTVAKTTTKAEPKNNTKVSAQGKVAKEGAKSVTTKSENKPVAKENTKTAELKTQSKPVASKTKTASETKVEEKTPAKAVVPNKAEENKVVFKEINSKTGKVETNTEKTKAQDNKAFKTSATAKNNSIAGNNDKKIIIKKADKKEVLASQQEENKQNAKTPKAKQAKAKSDNNSSAPKLSIKDKMVAFVAQIGGKNNASTDSKQKNTKNVKDNNSGNGKKALTIKNIITDKKMRLYAIAALALFVLFILILSISLGVVAQNKDALPGGANYTVKDSSISKGSAYDYEYRTTAAVGYNAKVLGTVERKIPTETKNQGMVTNQSMYPKYGYTPTGITEEDRRQLISEAWQITCINTRIGSDGFPRNTYNAMDADGNLYLNGISEETRTPGTPSKLYKHTCADGMYFGNVSDTEQAIVKQMTFSPRTFHSHGMYSVTGLYAPAGEVIKVEISEQDMNTTGGIIIHIGQALYNSKANNIWLQKGQMQRFPVILNTMVVDKTTATFDADRKVWTGYVGSFVGGPIYVRNEGATFTTTISGGVAYSHFILGYTTPEEFEANKDSSAPYFDLEVWDNGVLHSGPKKYSAPFSYDDLFKVAVLWDKITSVTTYGNNQNIVFLYDPFVAAGAAVAFPSQQAVNCPAGWMANSLNYETMVKNGAWGNLHEYHHNFQGFGVGNGGEVTNNALTLVSYALFTKISSKRGLANFGAYGLGGWERYTSATFALDQVKKIQNRSLLPENGDRGLALYATLLHNFGAEAFMQVRRLGGGQSYQNYFKKWEQVTHTNMTYYFTKMLRANDIVPGSLTAEWLAKNSNPDYPMFVPVSSIYQTGRSYNYDDENKYFQTMQPYVIAYGQKFTIDLSKYTIANETPLNNNYTDNTYKSGSIVLPDGFSYKVIKVTQPENGTITKESDYIYHFSPNSELNSGKIYVTLQITKDDHAFEVQNVDLVLEFQQSHDLTGRILERTTYEFDSKTYDDAQTAYKENYAGYSNKITGDNKNSVQNSNTDIWLTTDALSSAVSKNSIMEVSGKLYIAETGRYKFTIRGRRNVALFLSFDKGKTYQFAAKYVQTNSNNTGFPNTEDASYIHKDEDGNEIILEENTWVYFKEVMIVQKYGNIGSFVGLGMGKIPDPMPVMDADGNPVLDANGQPVTTQPDTVISYANAYRNSFEFTDNTFESDYFYTKDYNYSYTSDEKIFDVKQNIVSNSYKPWDSSDTYKIENLFDNNDKTFIHTNRDSISEANPFEITVKLDSAVSANRLTFVGSSVSGQYATYVPRNFKIWISNDGSEWTQVADVVNARTSGLKVPVEFDKTYDFSYYKVQVTDTHAGHTKYLALNKIQLSYILSLAGGKQTAVGDNKVKLYGTWNIEKTISKFGRVYVGKKNSSIEFTYTGKRLILFSSAEFGTSFEVYIDGKKIDSIEIKENTSHIRESYISPELQNKQHNVVIKCLGEANFESIVRM